MHAGPGLVPGLFVREDPMASSTWIVGGRDILEGHAFLLMGVLNLTPDSFSDGGLFLDPGAAEAQALRMVAEGAGLLDLGAESSRPGSEPVSGEEEWRRLGAVLKRLRAALPALPISVDTTKSSVGRRALDEGADILNDISAGRMDSRVFALAAERSASLILMHSRGTPKTMQEFAHYDDACKEVASELGDQLEAASRAGVAKERVVLDPGIGFSKRVEDNVALLRDLRPLHLFGRPLLVGASRKSLIGALTGAPVEARLPGTLALHCAALQAGARIFRVHDVEAHRQALTCASAVAAAKESKV